MKVTMPFNLAACTIAFSQATYVVNEQSGPARIDVVACNSLAADVDITINTRDGSASGES